jgi:PiT family inorganic phosphate transporter
MHVESILLALAVIFGFYMAWSIGANDVANAMGTSVGSGALTIKRAVIIAAVLEFSGAFFVGSHVSETIRKGIVDPIIFQNNPMDLVYGMTGALLAAAIWLQVATYFGWPVSTTHSIVGSVIGFGMVIGGTSAVDWSQVTSIVSSWVISPLLSGTIAFIIFTFMQRIIYSNSDPVRTTKRIVPAIVFIVFVILSLTMVFKGLKNLHLDLDFIEALGIACIVGSIAAVISHFLVKRIKTEEPDEQKRKQPPMVVRSLASAIKHLEKISLSANGRLKTEAKNILQKVKDARDRADLNFRRERVNAEYMAIQKIFVYLQILSASFVAFAHGANDVANAVGPLAAVVSVLKSGQVTMESQVPMWILGMGGVGIVIGLATWGWRVMETIGKKITELTPTRGFAAEFAAATTIVIASKLGLPISTTHTLVGGVLGVGLARGIGALNLRIIGDIIVSWVITIPIGAGGAILFYYILKGIFG